MDAVRLPQISFQDWKYLDAHLVWIYEGAPRKSGITRGGSQYMTAWYLLQGRVVVRQQGVHATAKQGDWLFLPPGKNTREFSEDAQILSLHFNACWITGQQLFSFKHTLIFESAKTRGWLKFCRPMLRLVRQCYPDAYHELPAADATFAQYTKLQGDFLCWLRQVFEVLQSHEVDIFLPQRCDARVLRMMRWIDSLPIRHSFRMQEMTTVFGLSPAQVNRLFCADCGITPKRYFEGRRLKFARATLVSSTQAVKAISYQVGFKHQSEFTAWFKKHTGESPSAYRAMNSSSR